MNRFRILLTMTLLSVFSSLSMSEEEIIMIESTITGSQEQPKVISIVPWKPAADPDYIGEKIQGLGLPVNVFQSLNRVNFNRERLYINATRPNSHKKVSGD